MNNQMTTGRMFHRTILQPAAMLFAVCAGCFAAAAEPAAGLPPEQRQRLELMQSRGTDGSLTILPVRLAGKPSDRVSEVVGVLLEKQGLTKIVLGKTPFGPADTNWEGLAGAVGAFVTTNPIATDHALYAEFDGDRRSGLIELRAVVVDRTGAVVWTDRLTREDEALKEMEGRDPMAISVLLVERLGPQLALNDATARAAKPGRMAAIMDERSGLPPEQERAALSGRQQAMKQALPGATLLVYPARVGGNTVSMPSATNVARLLNEAGWCQAVPAGQPLLLPASLADPNELKGLWNLAREFRDHVRAHPPASDYALYADYAFNPQNADQGFVHWVVCDRRGEWVFVDMQNSHQPDYQSVGVISRERCDQLLVKCLEESLK
jgi:hypothetical protein